MVLIEKNCRCTYRVIDEDKFRDFETEEEAEEFMEGWIEFKEENNKFVEKMFFEWGEGLKISFEWTKK